MERAEQTGVAIFDLDKTLTVRSTYTPFILFAAKRRPLRFLHAPRLVFLALLMLLGVIKRDDVKIAMWRAVISGMSHVQAQALGTDFAKHWVRTALRPGAREVIARHKAAGDQLVLASAAVDIVADPFARLLGFDDIVATRTAWGADGRATGAFDGLNCYGGEKLLRVKAVIGNAAPAKSAAYSDHITDLPLLTWAMDGFAVNPHKPLADIALAEGLTILEWGGKP